MKSDETGDVKLPTVYRQITNSLLQILTYIRKCMRIWFFQWKTAHNMLLVHLLFADDTTTFANDMA